ncbi:MAG: PRC-barrel domain-containing protein [Candidatus Aenigmatarchaeota archaeon]
MPVNVRNMSEMFGKDVFTNKGVYCGKVNNVEVNLNKFRMKSLVIEAARGSYLAEMVGGKKGVIVPYQMIQSIGDIVLIKHIASPSIESRKSEEAELEEEETETVSESSQETSSGSPELPF